MARAAPRTLTVLNIEDITPNMRRLTLGGTDMQTLPAQQESAYLKFIFPDTQNHQVAKRSYTIINQRPTEIDVDFVLHETTDNGVEGPALTWVKNVKVGDDILVAGPGPTKLVSPGADWYLLVGDMTALPAITANLAQMPQDATGHAVIEVLSEQDIQNLAKPKNIEIHWIIVPHASADKAPLLDKVKSLTWPAGLPEVWAACEFNSMRALRHYFKHESPVTPCRMYISSYWKIDSSDDEHKIAKRLEETQAV